MGFDKDILMKEEQRKDLMHQVEQYRLVQQALAGRPSRAIFWRRLVQWLGQQLIDTGCCLLRQFDRPEHNSSDSLKLYPCEEGI
jgi:hypothetical protein